LSASIRDTADLLVAPIVQRRVTRVREHRPWPMPQRRWVMAQTWKDLLFAHWDVDPPALRALVPPPLTLDTLDDRAWISVTPFVVRNLRPRLGPPVPWLSNFAEINVRTYVVAAGRPGIYFLSLDAASGLAVAAARRAYRLPYFQAEMSVRREGASVRYETTRISGQIPAPATFRGRYRPTGPAFTARPGTLDHWLAERYCLYTFDGRGRPLRGEIHHPPWPLQTATAEIDENTMGAQAGLSLDSEPVLRYARREDVVFWPLEAV
jgi:uncharacterized protein